MKPYFWGKDANVESGIYALVKFVTYNKSAHSCSLNWQVWLHCRKRRKSETYVYLSSTTVCKIMIFSCINFSRMTITSHLAPRNKKRQSSCTSLSNAPRMWILHQRATCTCIFHTYSDFTFVELCRGIRAARFVTNFSKVLYRYICCWYVTNICLQTFTN